MPDQRPHRRYKVEFMDISGAVIQENNTEIIDISISGISLQIKRRLNVGEQYTIKFYSLDKVFNLKGTVVWSKISKSQKGPHGDTIPIYTAGLEFQDLSKDKKDAIIHFMGMYKKDNSIIHPKQRNELRQYPRIQINTPVESFVVDQTENLTVKELSFSGALIESKQPMKINNIVPMMISLAEDKFIVFRGRVASCLLIKKAYPKAYDIGIEFTDLSIKERKTLAEFIRLLDAIDQSPSE